MVLFDKISKVFSYDLENIFCIEINFKILDSNKFDNCWMGKLPNEESKQETFWFGLTSDGLNKYDFSSFEEMSNAEVFDGQSLKQICSNIVLLSIDGLDPDDRTRHYTNQ